VSSFSDVDAAEHPERLGHYLDVMAQAASGMKHYAAAAHAIRHPNGPVLDLGRGAGHDLEILRSRGIAAVGVDPSAVLLRTASERASQHAALVRAVGETLPFRDGAFAGCRIERVLMHVVDPQAVLEEAVRVLARGSLITVYEPNWSSFTVRSEMGDQGTAWISAVRHPGIGGDLWQLLEGADCEVLDRVEELSVWKSLTMVDALINLTQSVGCAIEAGRIRSSAAHLWLAEQWDREARGMFHSTISKVLVVARKL
jgi:SAM-dependent methyltransferase